MSEKSVVPEKSSRREQFAGNRGKLLYPIHNHLETEPCTESCLNHRAKLVKATDFKLEDIEA